MHISCLTTGSHALKTMLEKRLWTGLLSTSSWFSQCVPLRKTIHMYITNVVAGFFNPNDGKAIRYVSTYEKINNLISVETWKKSKWFPELKKSARRAWHDIVQHFKDVACTSIYTYYPTLQIPIDWWCDLAQKWEPIIDNLLKDRKYTDLVVSVSVSLWSVIQPNKWVSKVTRTCSSFHFITWHLPRLCTKSYGS